MNERNHYVGPSWNTHYSEAYPFWVKQVDALGSHFVHNDSVSDCYNGQWTDYIFAFYFTHISDLHEAYSKY